MKLFLILILVCSLCGCSSYYGTTKPENIVDSQSEDTTDYITYEETISYIKQSESNIINSNSNTGLNKYGESATEKIIYSDEYASLYCAIWSALEEIGTPNEDRFSKSKLRWEIDFTNEEWKKELINAYNEGGKDAFYSKYADIYSKKVFPAVQSKWKSEQ